MHVAIDAIGIRDGGSASILEELVHWLPLVRPTWRWTLYLMPEGERSFELPALSERVEQRVVSFGSSRFTRLAWTNVGLPIATSRVRANALLSLANLAPWFSTVPQVVLCHQRKIFGGFRESSSKAQLRLAILRRSVLRGAKASSKVVVQTNDMRRGLEKQNPQLGDKIVVIPSGFRTTCPNAAIREEKSQAIEESTSPRLLYVSHARSHKNHEALLRAFARLLPEYPTASLLLTVSKPGQSYDQSLEATASIHALAQDLGITDRIVWMGSLSPNEVKLSYQAADIQVFTSLEESFGLPLVEAISQGCPNAVADLPYAHDVLGDVGTYFDPSSPEAIMETIAELLRNKGKRADLVARGYERSGRFHYEAIAEQYCEVIEESLRGKDL